MLGNEFGAARCCLSATGSSLKTRKTLTAFRQRIGEYEGICRGRQSVPDKSRASGRGSGLGLRSGFLSGGFGGLLGGSFSSFLSGRVRSFLGGRLGRVGLGFFRRLGVGGLDGRGGLRSGRGLNVLAVDARGHDGRDDGQHDEHHREDLGDALELALRGIGSILAKEGLRAAANGTQTLLLTLLHQNSDDQSQSDENQNNVNDDGQSSHGTSSLNVSATQYAQVLVKRMQAAGAEAYLVNTGWNGTGKRISIKDTRGIIDAILDGSIEKAEMGELPIFNLAIPKALPGVDPAILDPRDTYADKAQWEAKAKDLAGRFVKNFEKYATNAEGKALIAAGPKA